jgi:hypothetical protein
VDGEMVFIHVTDIAGTDEYADVRKLSVRKLDF